ncbi:MAG: hypothetical protein ABSC19_05485 [Syntrophorhabdales bacterium]|jgi:hypothetical protein
MGILVRKGKEVSIIVIVFALFVATATISHAATYNLSADTEMMDNGEKQLGKIYVKGEKYRVQRQGEADYIILRHDLGAMWVVIPKDTIYVELPLEPKRTPQIQETNPGEISRKHLGSEVVDGHPAEKYEITVKEGSKTESFYQWTATDLDFPIKTTALEGEWSVVFSNIKKGVPDSIFEIPEGYDRARVVVKPKPTIPKGEEGPDS